MAYETLLLEKHGYVAVLTLNRPPTNSVSYTMLGEIEKALAEVASDKDARALVITGAGDRCFSAGMDVADALNHPDVGDVGRALWTKVDLFEKPTIAAINGHALGGGCELTLACHFRYMADNPKAVIGCPEVNLGITPGWGGTQRMTRLLGRTKALDLMLNAKRLSPKEALDIGLVEAVFAPEELMPKVMEYATALSERAPLSVQAIVQSSTAFMYKGIEEGLKVEASTSKRCVASKDATEGFTAFMEKRKPNFKGE
ncbi:MAG TPA: enoyl-CoA hydratase-related protein [Deltaproteobacteria bacterium]|nr:enoyl-CoA hydratase-related protein [Deltaproteobacteria bacterium]HPR55536.1 enoyl-CoA hydratase-related protein [Deltaproteobacteria bacterium]HXK48340.1 enoyl-CoA hydratase-related protein [Deltaproteobacteria bacterium]